MSHAGTLQIGHLHKHYHVDGKRLPVLHDVSLSVEPGAFVSVVGASGCGKSTLLRLIVGLDADYEGELLLDGHRIVGTSLERGIVFQEHRLFPWLTVEQNIALGLLNAPLDAAEKQRSVREHIELVGLAGFEQAWPHQLSGGMSQRVAIARALVNRPEVLLLDEPFGALDALTRAHLQQELHRIWQAEGITTILVTHDVEEAVFLGQQVVVMEPRPGRVRRIVPVDLPYPRDRASAEFHRIKDGVLRELGPPRSLPVAAPRGGAGDGPAEPDPCLTLIRAHALASSGASS
jgi:sulfonate transport system ATP-binding protein